MTFQQENRGSAVIQDFFFCPDFFPYLLIADNILESCIFHSFHVPLRTFQLT